MITPEIIRWSAVAAMAAALLRWPNPGAPFWALAAGRPFVVTRQRQGVARFRTACPV